MLMVLTDNIFDFVIMFDVTICWLFVMYYYITISCHRNWLQLVKMDIVQDKKQL